MFHEVMDAACASAQMPLQALAHHTPAEPWPVADRDVRIRHAEHASLDERENLLVERGLKAVGRMARKGLAQPDRLLADRCVERHRALDDGLGRLRPAHHFDEGNDVGRIERVADDAALGTLGAGLDDVHGNTSMGMPDELDARIAPGGAASSISANSLTLNSGRSGAFSWTKSASASARLMLGVKVSRSREASATTSPALASSDQASSTYLRRLDSALGAGSVATTSNPRER